MKCQRCAHELPGGAQFCMSCGTPVMAATPIGGINYSRPVAAAAPPSTNKKLIAGITAGLLLLALALFFGYRMLTDRTARVPDGSRVVEAPAVTPTGSGLVDKNARVQPPGPLTDRSAVPSIPAPQHTDLITYLQWLKQIDRERIVLYKKQMAQAFEWSARGPESMYKEEMKENPDHSKSYKGFQGSFGTWQSEWQALSTKFLANKQVPQPCMTLHNHYYEILSQLSSQMVTIGTGFSDALSGSTSDALGNIMALQGNREGEQACAKADDELKKICKSFNLTLFDDWDIRAEPGSGLFNLGR